MKTIIAVVLILVFAACVYEGPIFQRIKYFGVQYWATAIIGGLAIGFGLHFLS